jgi:VWFA-related protein
MKKIATLPVIILLISLIIVGNVSAQSSGNLIIHNVESVVNEDGDSYTVSVLLSALDSEQLPIPELTAQDFSVMEDSQPVELDEVEMMRDLPISVILVMDVSGSMQGNRLDMAKTAISQFIKSLYRGDEIAIYSFNEEIQEVVSLTDDLNQARDTFESAQIYAGGGTCLFDATYHAAQRASDLPEGRQAVVVLSDGYDTINGSDTCSTYTVADILSLSEELDQHIPIYTIGVGTDIDSESLGAIAEEMGGTFTQSTANSDLPQLFEQLANRLSSEYQLTYTSTNEPGKHGLTVSVRGLSAETEFELPGLPPVISVAYPEEGQVLEPGVNTIKLSLVERGIQIDTLTFKLNGVAIGVGGEVGQPPYEYEIDFSQYEGQEVEMTILALDEGGNSIAETTVMMNLTGEEIVTGTETTTTPGDEENAVKDDTCPEGFVCIGNLQLTTTQLVLIGVGLLVIVLGVFLLIFFNKKRKEKGKKEVKKESLFEDATMDGFELPGGPFGRLTILSSDDPLMNGKEFQLMKSPTTIGRSVSNDIALPKDSAVSRKHVEIMKEGEKVILKEFMKTLSDGTKQPPTYGTYVNDRKITGEAVLHNGDEIGLGRRTKLRFEGQTKPAAEAESEDVTVDQIELPDMDQLDDATRDG